MKTAIALGTFDGLHAGHRAVIEKTADFYSVAVTFKIPPKNIISGDAQLLMLPQQRELLLNKLGVDKVEMQKFEDVRNIEADDYLEKIYGMYKPSRIVCGYNYRFGKNALGDTELLTEFCKKNDIEFCCVSALCDGKNEISSTVIREYIKNGEIEKANNLLFENFSFESEVVHGDERGRTLGFPTANQIYPDLLVRAKFGVYISRVTIDGNTYAAITNVGIRPTFKTNVIGCETYIKGFCGDIYGKVMKTELVKFIREEKKFNTLDELKQAILNDVKLIEE